MASETTLPPSDFEPDDGASRSVAPAHVPPEIDVPALRAFLDGEYAEIRDLVRANLAEYASILTDAETMTEDEAASLRAAAGPIRIQAVEFGDGPSSGAASPLRSLATATGGTFRHVDLSTLAAPASP